MMKKCLFALALLSLALASGCATGGSGVGNINVSVSNQVSEIYPGQSITFHATVTPSSDNQAVTWKLSGTACTGSSNPCGTIDANTGAYQAPSTPPNPAQITVTATAKADFDASGSLSANIVLVSVVVTPLTVNVGSNLIQQFTAVAIPDDAPQTFTWKCTPVGSCGTLVQDSNISGLAVYTAPASSGGNVTVEATSTVAQSPAAIGQAAVSLESSRLPSGNYAFQSSGFDSNGNAAATAGSITVGSGGTITGGVEDVVSDGVYHQYTSISGSYTASANNGADISNNLGTLTIAAGGGPTYNYTAVITAAGAVRMIESGSGTAAGVMEASAGNSVVNAGAQKFAFGFAGVDTSGQRTGYVGLLPLNGSGAISGGLLDSNDNGASSTLCGSPPCGVSGSYALSGGVWNMTLNVGGNTLHFDFFVAGGATQSKTVPNPLTFYAISTDPGTNPAVSGQMTYQVPATYNNADFNGTSVSDLTGVVGSSNQASNVALVVGTTDGTSGGSGGTGGFSGTSDQNNDGTIVSIKPTAPFSNTYVATNGNTGRYVFQMLGSSSGANPLNFVLYASGADRGFLLDQSSAAVLTGNMSPQPTTSGFFYTSTELPGTYAAATIALSDPNLAPAAQNLLLTSPGNSVFNVAGKQNPGSETLTGTYILNHNSAGGGTGTITLTAPSAATYAIYAIDGTEITGTQIDVVTDFMMMGTTSGTPSAIMFAQQ